MIHLDLNNLTQAMVDEALPHLGACTYTAPCLLGAMMTPEERKSLKPSNNETIEMLSHLIRFPDEDQLKQAARIQDAFDQSRLNRLKQLLPHLEFNA